MQRCSRSQILAQKIASTNRSPFNLRFFFFHFAETYFGGNKDFFPHHETRLARAVSCHFFLLCFLLTRRSEAKNKKKNEDRGKGSLGIGKVELQIPIQESLTFVERLPHSTTRDWGGTVAKKCLLPAYAKTQKRKACVFSCWQ